MKNKKLKTLLTSALLVSGSVLFGMLSLNNLTESKASNISISGDNGVDVYVSGEGVTYNDSTKKYEVQDGTKVTVTVVNDQRMFTSMKIGENEYNTSVVETTASGNLEIEIETTYSTAAHQGKCFGRAWSLSSEADITKLVNILNGTDPQYSYFAGASTLEDIQYGYYYITDSIFYDVSNSETNFYGIGTATNPFHGCIDFLNNYVSISSTTNGNIKEEYAGFFGVVENGSGREINFGTILGENNVTTSQKECVLRNVSVKGNISFRDTTNSGSVSKLSVGGIAGKVSKDVILDNIDSSVSISVEASHTAVTAGAIFGTLETRIDTWEKVKASGAYTTVKAISNGSGKDVYVGSLAGEVNNVSVYGFNNEISNGIYIANSLNNASGNSIASSFVGVLNAGKNLVYENIKFIDYENIDVSSVIKNSTGSSKNVYGALGFGLINGSSKVDINSIDFIYSAEKENLSNLYMSSIRCSTADVNSKGNAYAGGLIAYSNNSNVYWNNIENKTLYKTNVYIEAEVNGLGSAFAGGIFGYSPALVDNTVNKNIVLNAEDTTIEVYATQLTNCKESNDSTYNIGVASGYYAPLLDINSESQYLHNLNLTVNNGTVSSTRQVGSEAEGNIYAGGLIGVVYCRTNYANQLVNLTINLNNSSVSGLGLSFMSEKEDMWKNNVDVGGMFGHLDQCGVMGSFDSTNLTANSSNSKLGASNLNVNILVGSNNEEYAVKGIQNAAAGDHDHQNQGHIGGAIGMLRGGYISNINVTGDSNSKVKPIITFNSTNSPNTAAAGGVIGENARDRSVLIEDASADNIHVICRAFSTKQTDDGQYDVYAGGIIGVLANNEKVVTYMVDSNVNNSTVECVGEEKMLSICGGIVGGAWWGGTAGIYNSIVTDSNVLANSVSFKAYAGGFAGVLQISTPTFDNIIIVNNYISATSNSAGAYSAGVVAWAKKNVKLSNVYLNSIILGEGGPGTGTSTSNQTYSRFIYSEGGNSGLSNIFINPENLSLEEGTNSTTFVEFVSSNSSEVDPLYISNTNNIYYSVNLKTGDSAYSLFNAYPLPANAILRFSGDVSYLKDSNGDVINADTAYTAYTKNTVRVNSNKEGTVYVSLRVVYDGKEYELVNQPIYINKGVNKLPDTIELKNYSSSSKTVITSDNDQVAGYNQKENLVVNGTYTTDYYYAIVNVGQTEINGNKNAAQSIQISYSDFENYNLYTTTASFANELGEKDNNYLVPENADYETRIKSILANKKEVMDFTFFDSLIFGYEGSSVILTPRGDITETVFIIYEFGNGNNLSTVVIEFVPNSLESIEVLPESYTNELGIRVIDDEKVYTYAPLDTINFKVVENHRFAYEYSSKGYAFTGPVDAKDRNGNSTSLSTRDVTVDSNGRTVIKNTNKIIGATFGVKATSATDSSKEDTIYIFVDNEVSFTYNAVGAYFESDRKVVDYTDFDFKVTPMAGYGLQPTKLNVILRTNSNSTTYDIKDLNYDLANSLLNQTVTANGINFKYSFNVIDGSYDITIPGTIITDEITSLLIEVEFGSTYNIVFDKGYEPQNGSGRYFIYQMTYGQKFDEYVYNQVLSYIGASQYGYEFQGYYLVQEGKTLNDYGYSFEEYCFHTNGAPDEKRVTGPMQFYARFTYEVIAMLPDIFELNTNLFIDEVMPLESNDPNSELIRIIPVDVNNGFTFTLKHDGTWYGDIPFEVYIIKKESQINVGYETINDETLSKIGVEKITDKVQTLAKNTYYIPPELINGYIVIRGFAEEMTFSCGESEVDTGIHDIYGDAIFTAMYSVTYNKAYAVDIKETVSYSNIEIIDGKEVVKGVGFGFKVKDSNGTYVPFYLPQNTSIRLYRFINHELYDVGVLVLKDGSKCEFFAHDFVDLRTGEHLVLPNVTGVFDQKYNLVITLPNYEGIKQDYKNVEICLLATFQEHYNFYDYVNETVEHVSEDDSKALAFDVFNVYKTLGFTVTEGTNSFAFTKGKELENLDDHRHENKYYVWKIAKTNPGFVEKINFGGLTPIVETNDAYYYLVTDGQTVTISQSDYNKLKGYTVAILEVENLQDPASGQLIYSKAIS